MRFFKPTGKLLAGDSPIIHTMKLRYGQFNPKRKLLTPAEA